jgi:hypothetical protein
VKDNRPPNTPPPAQDNEAALALRLGLIFGGGGIGVLSYLSAALYAGIGLDEFAFVNYVPILGPVLYSFTPGAFGGEVVCYTCAGLQAAGLVAAIAGFFVDAGGDEKPGKTIRVELPPRAPPPQVAMAF